MNPNPVLSDTENQLLLASKVDPSAYGVLSAQAQLSGNQPIGLGTVQEPDGTMTECLLVPMVLILPTRLFKARPGLLDKNGNPPNPAEGMVPIFQVRALVPLDRLNLRPRLVLPPIANGDFEEES